MKFGIFFVGEYVGIALVSAMIVTTLFWAAGSARCCRRLRLVL